jgi:hypothetical protein
MTKCPAQRSRSTRAPDLNDDPCARSRLPIAGDLVPSETALVENVIVGF